jgi:SAM-dependent methyltransferase
MNPGNSESIGLFFDRKWHLYQQVIGCNVLCHSEMFATLDHLLDERFGTTPLRFVDFGCGDGSAVLDTLKNRSVSHYIGVDAAPELLTNAERILAPLNCKKTLICKDISRAVQDLASPVDVIFCSYVLHHLLFDQKVKFIEDCYKKLNSPGYLIVVDGVAMDDEPRDHWLERLDRRIRENVPDLSAEDRAEIMKHPRDADHPETITTFRRIAEQSNWKNFEVLLERDQFLAFLVFSK